MNNPIKIFLTTIVAIMTLTCMEPTIAQSNRFDVLPGLAIGLIVGAAYYGITRDNGYGLSCVIAGASLASVLIYALEYRAHELDEFIKQIEEARRQTERMHREQEQRARRTQEKIDKRKNPDCRQVIFPGN